MIVKCVEDKDTLSGGLKTGNEYFCFEIYQNVKRERVSYRIVNEYGRLALYDDTNFIVKENQLTNMVYISNPEESYYIIRLEEIQKLEESSSDIEGIWGEYYDGNKEVEEKIHKIVKEAAELEGYSILDIETT